MLEKLSEISRSFLRTKNSPYRRSLLKHTIFSHRMSIITGQRGVGKTTALIQLLLEKVEQDVLDTRVLYIQADHFVMGSSSLYEIAEHFCSLGGKWLAIDEIHKYPTWSKELKSIYDTFPELQLFVSGSSALEIYKGTHDLIRRSVNYRMQGLSFREYLELQNQIELPITNIKNLCKNHERFVEEILLKFKTTGKKVLSEFYTYLRTGYYPYYFEILEKKAYYITLEQNLHITVESDLAAIYPHLNATSIKKIKLLLTHLASSVPFTPNWTRLAQTLEIGDVRTLKNYFQHLEDATLIRSFGNASQKLNHIDSSLKTYLDNPNFLFAISDKPPDKGTLRETFFMNALSYNHKITIPKSGDFLVDQEYLFEIGGKKKGFHQIKSHPNAFIASDEIERGFKNKIPLWLFGFLY